MRSGNFLKESSCYFGFQSLGCVKAMAMMNDENNEGGSFFENSLSEEIWSQTYRNFDETNPLQTFKRVSNFIASAEKTEENKEKFAKAFYDELSNLRFISGGRILANAGTKWENVSMINCFTGGRPKYDCDSLNGILEVLNGQSLTLKSEGGWGLNFSFIRPRGAFISGVGVESPGPVKFMELFDKSSDVITSGSSLESTKKEKKGKIRKGAQMAILSCWHPSVKEFITAKQTEGRLTKFNMSVYCTNDFMDKVLLAKSGEKDVMWDLVFPDTKHPKYKEDWDGDISVWKSKGHDVIVYESVPVLELWNLIMESTYNRAEPGVLFLDRANETYCFSYGESRIQETNACSEQTMPPFSSCNLLSINLAKLFNKETGQLDLSTLEKTARTAIRFSDNVNDLTVVPIPEYNNAVRNLRRIGIGVMGWGSLLYLLNIRFASDEAEEIKEKIMSTICYSVIDESANIAKEKGMFMGCDPVKHSESYFFDLINLPQEIREKIKKYGVRNSSFFSIQPTGNSSIFANNISGGCEPIFMPEYVRTVIVQSCPEELIGLVPKYWEGEFVETNTFKFSKEGDDQILKAIVNGTTYKIDRNRGLTKEAVCEDHSVRYLKSINKWNPEAEWAVTTSNLSVDDHLRDMKGFTKWLDASCSKTVNIPNDYPFESFENVYLDAYKSGTIKGITTYRAGTMVSVLKSKDEKPIIHLNTQSAPKRPKSLPAEVHCITAKGEKFVVAVGLLDGTPYEILGGAANGFNIKKSAEGQITKVKRGQYSLSIGDLEISDFSQHFTPQEQTIFRMASTLMRHGVPTEFIIEQMQKSSDDIFSLPSAIARVLKKYIKDGQTISGATCPECGSDKLVYVEGCKRCHACNWTACS